ncbi:S9 family peptidase [Amycolatopsis decaplanina]|uniref:Dipeptidyl aminopeptidase/acylaminoacyl-peptidase n=1 Tax=Amycolatopsis decaplanina DSM 44594 TaxID=1284240 RepID=M2ZXU5_9PSEU|nr:S9 family peptidase [Amycolatopsis decaplanina]EME65154.1 dipeptidyl aminopeptidase/acylaminoacyl-peptidase [Amycolatopsis decaplanina DSM 44594]
MRPVDIEALTVPGILALHGDLLLTAVSRPDLKTNSYRGGLRRVDLGGGGEGPWTHGTKDSAPAFSPDGRWVAFLRAGEGSGRAAKPQVHVIPAAGGDAKRITDLPLGAGAPVWAPDSRRIAFVARVPEPGRYGTENADGETPEPGEEAPRHITNLFYRVDDAGFLNDRPQRLFVVDTVAALHEDAPAELTPLTDDRADVEHPSWTADGEHVLFTAPRDWAAEDTVRSDVYAVPAAGGEPRLLVRTPGTASRAVCAPDGSILFYGTEFPGLEEIARNTGLWQAPWPVGAEPSSARRLTDVETVDCDNAASPPVVLGGEVLLVVRTRGAAELRAVPLDAELAELKSLRYLAGERAAVKSFAVDGERIAAVIGTPESSGDVVLLSDGEPRVLTDYSKTLRDSGILPLEELNTTAPDGYPVHGWIVRPEGDGPHPVVLMIHGGPFAPYEWKVFDEAQVLAEAGYAVILGNPRGSAGYGESHGRSIVHGFGTVDADDLLALLDEALKLSNLDSDRVGVMGGSYGGFMTSWLAAHHGGRFRAAWSERAVNAWDSFVGSSDIGWFFAGGYVGDDLDEQRKRSPLTYAGKIDIPFMVVHSEQDWRCPLEQAQRMYVALRQNGVEAEFLLFPGEGHELTRSGLPRHRVQRFDAVLEWWGRHL